MQNKKSLVVAVAAALAIQGAWAKGGPEPDNVVELYGKVYPEFVFPSGSGATEAGAATCTICGTPEGEGSIVKRTEMESSNSRLGVRGHERLGGNLKAIFQLETEFHVDSNDSSFATRDSFVGLSGGWGTVKLGRMDTPFKNYGDDLSFLGISSGNFVSTSEVLRKTGFGTNSASSFHLRRTNAVQYESPEWGGFNFAAMYSTNEAKTATRDPRVVSIAGKYEVGKLYLALAFEQHWDLFGGSRNAPSSMSNFANQGATSKDKAVQATVKYTWGIHTFEADWNRKEYEESGSIGAGRFSSYENTAWLVNWQARWSKQWRTQVYYIKAEKGSCSLVDMECNTNGLDSSQFAAGFAYYFSPRTYLFVIGALLKNGYSARFNNSNQQEPSVGEDIRQIAVGLHTAF